MATILAKSMKIFVGSTAITCQTDASLQLSTNMFQITCKDSTATSEFSPGAKSWSMSGTAFLDFAATYGFEELFSSWNAQTSVAVVMQDNVTGNKKYSGTAYVSSLSLNSSGTDEAVSFQYELQGTGAIAEATI